MPADVVGNTDDHVLASSAGAEPLEQTFSPDSIVFGRTSRMRAVFEFLQVVADSESNVVIIGETGTGKELIARFIHHHSPRRRRPFVSVSCAILTESLIESELFGHERGAFTGAVQDRPGRFEMAERGTIFLDDIDDVPPAVQLKLLRVIQQRTIERFEQVRSRRGGYHATVTPARPPVHHRAPRVRRPDEHAGLPGGSGLR